jgi:hypothetical protein
MIKQKALAEHRKRFLLFQFDVIVYPQLIRRVGMNRNDRRIAESGADALAVALAAFE